VSDVNPESKPSSRREFLRRGATAAIALPSLAAIGCERQAAATPQKIHETTSAAEKRTIVPSF